MRLHPGIVGDPAPHCDHGIPQLLVGKPCARLSQFACRPCPVHAVTTGQFPGNHRDQERIVRAGQALAVAQGLQAAWRAARPDDQPVNAKHRSARIISGSPRLLAAALPASAASHAASQAKVLKDTAGTIDEPLCQSNKSTCVDAAGNIGGKYVGHDEPSLEFKSSLPGSGNDMTYV